MHLKIQNSHLSLMYLAIKLLRYFHYFTLNTLKYAANSLKYLMILNGAMNYERERNPELQCDMTYV